MEDRVKWIAIGILFFKFSLASCFYPEYIVEKSCKFGNETVIYDTSKLGLKGSLKTTSSPPYTASKNCTLIIKPPEDQGVVLSVRKIDFRERLYSCQDYIKVYHSDVFTSPTILCRFQFDVNEKSSFYSKGVMKIIYHVEPGNYPEFNSEEGFTLTYTIVSETVEDCIKSDAYMCGNGRCISRSLTCDGHNNCGDRSDESHILCDSDILYYFQMSDLLYVIVFSVLIVTIIITCAIVVTRKKRRSDDTDSVSDADEPTARLTPYQAVHPIGFFICQNPAGPDTRYPHHLKIEQSEGGFSNPCYPNGIPPPPIQPPPPYSQ